ncbi:hypothetical protein [Streptomyces sp. MST-110588]|uniref:hypothetical protein n=1 Tax=Streptomyces sp. MST-110588 TaxID=2833628 RepID=UPI001F5CD3EE|nr:hypothetical protein [Streptomyces sp. MST-110588]
MTATAAPAPAPVREARSQAYETLARLGHVDDRLTLSAAECAALEGLAGEWLARGAGEGQLVCALTAGLPATVYSPGAFVRTRLTGKIPPERVTPPSTAPAPARAFAPVPAPTWMVECTDCGIPGPAEALAGGLCRPCHGDPPPAPSVPLTPIEVHAHAARVRAARITSPR